MAKEDNDRSDHEGGGDEAGSKKLELTPAELEAKIASVVDARVQTAVKSRDEDIRKLTQEKLKLEDDQANAGKSQDELVESQKTTIEELRLEVEGYKTAAGETATVFATFLSGQLSAVGEDAKAQFEKVCPESLDVEGKIELLSKLVAEGYFAPKVEGDGDGDGDGDDEGDDESQKLGGVEGDPKKQVVPKPGEGAGTGTGKAGLDQAESRRDAEASQEGGFNPWDKTQ